MVLTAIDCRPTTSRKFRLIAIAFNTKHRQGVTIVFLPDASLFPALFLGQRRMALDFPPSQDFRHAVGDRGLVRVDNRTSFEHAPACPLVPNDASDIGPAQ